MNRESRSTDGDVQQHTLGGLKRTDCEAAVAKSPAVEPATAPGPEPGDSLPYTSPQGDGDDGSTQDSEVSKTCE